MSTAGNKSLVTNFWEKFSASQYDAAMELLTDDATWTVMGTTALSGTFSKAEFTNLLGGMGDKAPNGIQVTPNQLTAEDDRVSIEAESYGEISNGKTYKNIYHFMIVCRDGKIAKVRDYLDTEHGTEIFGT
jgi:ketosteroid isomerase-like protein